MIMSCELKHMTSKQENGNTCATYKGNAMLSTVRFVHALKAPSLSLFICSFSNKTFVTKSEKEHRLEVHVH